MVPKGMEWGAIRQKDVYGLKEKLLGEIEFCICRLSLYHKHLLAGRSLHEINGLTQTN